MPEFPAFRQPTRPAPGAPFGVTVPNDAFDRITRLARHLLTDGDAVIVLVKDGHAWRSREWGDGFPQGHWAADAVIETGEPLWIEDGRLDPRCADEPMVQGPPFLRTYAAQPITLRDGSRPGVVCVASPTPQPYDASKMAQLTDLAAIAADEWTRAEAARELGQSHSDLDEARLTLAAVLRDLPVSILLTDRDMRLRAASEVWATNLGLDLDTAVGESLYDLAPEVYVPGQRAYESCLRGKVLSGRRIPLRGPNGKTRWVQTELKPWRDRTGAVIGLVQVSDDITELVEALRSLERTEERLNLALAVADIHVWEVDFNRKTLITSGGEGAIYGEPLTHAELAADGFARIDPRDQPQVRAAWRRHLKEGAPYRPEYRIRRDDGREVWVEGASTYVVDERGRPKRLVNAVRDITERKHAELALVEAKEAAEAASLAKSTFLATMSHEIRTPLNGVLGMAQAMAADELTDVQRERLDVVRQSGQALLAILSDLLDLSKIEAGKLELEETPFDIAESAAGAQAAFDAIARDRELSFVLYVEPKARGVYRGDPNRVRQILHNLISNALKFTAHGEVRVRVSGGHKGLVVSVSDTGIGIPADRLPGLFQRFEQVDTSTTRRFGGTGLGLAICSELAQLMGGDVTAESTVGQGSVFSARLPLPKVARRLSAPATPRPQLARSPRPAPRAPRILAAEDNAMNQQVLRILLEQAGIEPTMVGDGRAALEAWEHEPWDVILMDVQMPVMDGPSATRAIRAREAATGRAHTQIVALTANAMAHQVGSYLEAGMDAFVAKPIEVGQLYAALSAALERAAADEAEAA